MILKRLFRRYVRHKSGRERRRLTEHERYLLEQQIVEQWDHFDGALELLRGMRSGNTNENPDDYAVLILTLAYSLWEAFGIQLILDEDDRIKAKDRRPM